MRRFYCEKENITDGTVYFDKDESSHICKVLRMQTDDEIIVSDGSGTDFLCKIKSVGEKCEATVISSSKNENEPECQLVLFQSVIKSEKMDIAMQKAAEIGVTKIVPVITERTVVKIEDSKKEEKKQQRWQKIVQEGCKQCGRSKIPEVLPVVPFKKALELMKQYDTQIVAYEDEKTVNISSAVKKTNSICYFIGPEGGISEREHKELCENGAISVSLGKRILRAETAAIVCGAVILALMGEMDV